MEIRNKDSPIVCFCSCYPGTQKPLGRRRQKQYMKEEENMYAIEEGLQKINGEYVETFQRGVICGETELEVEAGTTGYKGGCRNAGSRTYLKLLCMSGDFYFRPIVDEEGNVTGITIACCGDDGLDAILRALEFAHEAIDDQRCEVDD